MKYVNGSGVLPDELLEEIQNYAEGVYVYIPKRESRKNKWGEKTMFRREMELRNKQIYDKYLEGMELPEIIDCYHLSPQSIRRIILSQKRKMEPVLIMIEELLREWNIESKPIQIYHSAWNINDLYVLKVYTDSNALKRNILMMKTLYKAGIPVPKIIELPDESDYIIKDDKFYILTSKLKGKNIVNINQWDDMGFFRFGEVLGKLHHAFRECEKSISYWNNSMLEEMNGWVSSNLLKFNPEYLDMKDVEKTIHELEVVYDGLPKQLIHRDVYLGNFLFDELDFSGYIDFDLSQSNIRIFDLCYFLLGILLEEDSNRLNEEKWYGVIRQVLGGYDSIVPLTLTEKKSIACVMMNIELLFVAYFLGEDNVKLAQDAAKLFYFVKKNKEKIQDAAEIDII